MKNIISLILILFFFSHLANAQNSILYKQISIEINDLSIVDVIKKIAKNENINFIYSKEIIETKKRINQNFVRKSIRHILEEIIKNTDLRYTEYQDAILLFKESKTEYFFTNLNIIDTKTGDGIPYASVRKLGEFDAKIANSEGVLVLKVDETIRNEQMIFSSMTYENDTVSMDSLLKYGVESIYLAQKTFKIQEVEININKLKQKTVGNKGNLSIGSIYLDTHGQQTAYILKNKKKRKAKVKDISVFLSKKGNANAPFRLRIYNINGETGKPETEILQDVLIYRPQKSGWFTMNISNYEINLPENGLLISIQGIYTDEFDKNEFEYTNTTNNNSKDFEFTPKTVSYGQRLGYSKLKGKNTWHYSLNHSWYQLKRRNFNVMISAKILFDN